MEQSGWQERRVLFNVIPRWKGVRVERRQRSAGHGVAQRGEPADLVGAQPSEVPPHHFDEEQLSDAEQDSAASIEPMSGF